MRLHLRWSLNWQRAPTLAIIFATRRPAFATSRALPAAILKCGATFASATPPRSGASFPPTAPSSTGSMRCWPRPMAMVWARFSNVPATRATRGLAVIVTITIDKWTKASGRALQQYLDLQPVSRMTGSVRLPGSKSISNRILLLAALARGDTRIERLLEADDVDRMLGALQALGISLERVEEQRVTIVHGAAGAFPVKQAVLSLGNAGTAFRPLTAVLALSGGNYQLSGAERMHERPIVDLVDALRAMGADVRYAGRDGYPPLVIGPGALRTGSATTLPIAIRGDVSSQFVSALLMA